MNSAVVGISPGTLLEKQLLILFPPCRPRRSDSLPQRAEPSNMFHQALQMFPVGLSLRTTAPDTNIQTAGDISVLNDTSQELLRGWMETGRSDLERME